jgi:F-box-like
VTLACDIGSYRFREATGPVREQVSCLKFERRRRVDRQQRVAQFSRDRVRRQASTELATVVLPHHCFLAQAIWHRHLGLLHPDRQRRPSDGQAKSMYVFFSCATSATPAKLNLIRCRPRIIPINKLPDEVLIEIFDFYVVEDPDQFLKRSTEAWQLLVHVCRRWRRLVFASPRRLNLRLFCKPEVPVRDKLDIWPALPLLIQGSISPSNVDNILAVLNRHDRVSMIHLSYFRTTPEVEKVWAAMHVPFPKLTVLRLWSDDFKAPIVPDSFLGGSSPLLREIWLNAVPFPGLPKLLLSATHLTEIFLKNITRSGYFSPETMITCLSALTSLKTLHLGFLLRSRPDSESRHPSSPTRSILPALTEIQFKGTEEYLEDLVSRIDAPQLNALFVSLINQIDFGVPQLAQFISRTPMFTTLSEARVGFCGDSVRLTLSSSRFGFEELKILLSCEESDRQLSTLARVWTSFSPLFSKLNNFFIHEVEYMQPHWQDNVESHDWLELLLPFTAVESLYVSKEFVPGITAALQELVRKRITEVLPTLRNLFLEGLRRSGPAHKNIGLFVFARQLLGRPIAVSLWKKDADIDSDSDWGV